MAVGDPGGTDGGTRAKAYTDRLHQKEAAWWKRALDVQRPYRWNLRRLDPGFTLDLGCGLGRNLAHLDGSGVGIDHNPTSVAVCRDRGLEAYTPDEFAECAHAQSPPAFDTLLAAHVVEHLPTEDATTLLRRYLPHVRAAGKVILITPQRRGYESDPTHVRYVDAASLETLVGDLGLAMERTFSFPFPWPVVGRVFTYNEFVAVARVA